MKSSIARIRAALAQSLSTALLASGALLFAMPAQSAIEIEVLDAPADVVMGQSTAVEVEFLVTNTQAAAFSGEFVVQGEVVGDIDLDDVDLQFFWIHGETVWNENVPSRVFWINPRDRSDDRRLNLTLESGFVCGVFALDVHPQTGEWYGVVAEQGNDNCDYDWIEVRRFAKFDMETGAVTLIGPANHYNAGKFTPDGRFIAQQGDRIPGVGSLHEVNLTTGVGTQRYGALSNFDDHPELVWNPEDGRLYQFHDCEVRVVNVDTWTGVTQDFDRCNWLGSMDYAGNNEFLLERNANYYRVFWDGFEWDDTYLFGAPHYTKSLNISGHRAGLSADCTVAGRSFECTVPTLVPTGQLTLLVEATAEAQSLQPLRVRAEAGAAQAEAEIEVIAPDPAVVAFGPHAVQYQGTDAYSYWVTVENLGDLAATGVQLLVELPANVNFVSSSAGSLAGNELTVNIGTLGVGADYTLTINVTAGADGVALATATVSSTNADGNLGNNKRTARNVIGNASNVYVTHTPDEDPETLAIGDQIEVDLAIGNLGPQAAGATTLSLTLPAGLSFVSASAPATDCDTDDDGVVTCNVGSFAVDAESTVTVVLDVTRGGNLSFRAAVDTQTPPDLNLGNNSTSVSLSVLPPSLSVALGASSPSGEVSGSQPVVAQVTLTHGGESDQALLVRGATLTLDARLSGRVLQGRVAVYADADGNGSIDEGDARLGEAQVTVAGDEVSIRFGSGVRVEADEATHLLLVAIPGSRTAEEPAAETASLGGRTIDPALLGGLLPLVFAGSLLMRRRVRSLWLAALLLLPFSLGGCDSDDAAAALGVAVQVTLVEVDAVLAEGAGPAAPVDGLPLEGPTVRVQR